MKGEINMIPCIITGAVCVLVSGAIGAAVMALLTMARDPDPPKREPEHKEPTILWTVGNLCMWKGKLCKIERFDTTSNNQTVVHLRREGLGYGLCVPIEELEEKE